MKTLKIKDICDKGSSALKQKDVEGKEGKYPVFGASGYISSIDTYHQDKDYIAIVKDGSGIGRVTFMPAYSSVIGTMQYILPKEGYNIKYISYCLQSLDLAKYKQGAAIPHIYFRGYGERYVNIEESLPEQERIVSLLDAEFAKIDAIKANAEKQLKDAKALFQSALKDYLTPKEGWIEGVLGDYISHLRTGLNPRQHFKLNTEDAEGYYITVRELKGFKIITDNKTDRVNKDALERINRRSELKIGDILFSGTGTIGNTALVSELPTYWNIKEGIYAITPIHTMVDSKFLIYVLGSDFFLNEARKKAEGTGVMSVPMKRFVKLKISVPTITEQKTIVRKLDKLSAKIHALQSNFDTTVNYCNDLKQSILKDIFS